MVWIARLLNTYPDVQYCRKIALMFRPGNVNTCRLIGFNFVRPIAD